MPATDEFLEEAAAIGDRLAGSAIRHGDHATWLMRDTVGTKVDSGIRRPCLVAAGPTVCDGTAGIALFLARLGGATLQRGHRETARAAMAHALWAVRRRSLSNGALHARNRHGFFFGSLGVAWTALHVASLLEDGPLERSGRSLLARVLADAGEPAELDVMGGKAGAIPALLGLASRGTEGAGAAAASFGHDLVRAADVAEDGWSWSVAGASRNLLGFAHGAAGFGYALACLYAAVREERFREAARGAFSYERSHFDPAARNWPSYHMDPGADGRPRFSNAWCHGASGIGLSRVLAHRHLGDRRLLAEARTAQRTARMQLRQRLDAPGHDFQLCHGIAGTAECLWLIEDALGMPGALRRARAVGRYGIERFGAAARRRWGPSIEWPTGLSHALQPSLLSGAAGVGHFLLRLHDPRTPTVLAGFESLGRSAVGGR